MILRPVNKLLAMSVGLPLSMCFSLNELKANLMAQSMRCPGYSTLLLNLCVADQHSSAIVASEKDLAECEPWQQQYFRGNNLEVVGCVLDSRFHGLTFWQAALALKQATGDLLLATQKDGSVMVFPGNHIIEPNSIVWLIADSYESASRVAEVKTGKKAGKDFIDLDDIPSAILSTNTCSWEDTIDYRPGFRANQAAFSSDALGAEMVQYMMREDRAKAPSSDRKSDPRTLSLSKRISGAFVLPGFSRLPVMKENPNATLRDSIEEAMALRENSVDKGHVDTAIMEHMLAEEADLPRNTNIDVRKKEETAAALQMVKEEGHILLLICQPELQWQQVVAFIRPLRAPYLPSFQHILVMGPGFPPKELWDMFKDVGFLEGDPQKRDDLQAAGAAVADKVVLLAGPPNPNTEDRLADQSAMLVNSTLEAIYLDAEKDRFSLFEYTHPSNASILPPVPPCAVHWSIKDDKTSANPNIIPEGSNLLHVAQDASSISQPRYAAGRIFIPALFGALFAQSHSTPGIMELMEALTLPSRRGQVSYPFMLPALERVAAEWIGKTYGELCESLLKNGLGVILNTEKEGFTHVMPMGLYRRTVEAKLCNDDNLRESYSPPPPEPMGTAHQGINFVYTNPKGNVPLLPGDQVYVLACAEWGSMVLREADTKELDDNDNDIFPVLSGRKEREDQSQPRADTFSFSMAAPGRACTDQPPNGDFAVEGNNRFCGQL